MSPSFTLVPRLQVWLVVEGRVFCFSWIVMFLFFSDFQLNSHLTTLASIHKIHHTLHRLVNTYKLFTFFKTCLCRHVNVHYTHVLNTHRHVVFLRICFHRTWRRTLDRTAIPQVITQSITVWHRSPLSYIQDGVSVWEFMNIKPEETFIINVLLIR